MKELAAESGVNRLTVSTHSRRAGFAWSGTRPLRTIETTDLYGDEFVVRAVIVAACFVLDAWWVAGATKVLCRASLGWCRAWSVDSGGGGVGSDELQARPPAMSTDRPSRDSLEQVYTRLRSPMVRLAHLLTGSVEVAEDVVQDAFVSCSRHWSRLDIADAYIRRAVINHARSALRRVGRERDKTARYGRVTPVAVGLPELDETWGVLRRLPDRQRMAVVLRFYEDLPEAEIAELLGCRLGTVKSLIHRALARLSKEIER